MRAIKNIGLIIFVLGVVLFSGCLFLGKYNFSKEVMEATFSEKQLDNMRDYLLDRQVVGKEYASVQELSGALGAAFNEINDKLKAEEQWDKVMWDNPHEFTFKVAKVSAIGAVAENKSMFFWLTFGLSIIGALLFILPNVILLGPPGIKNDGHFQSSATSRGWVGYIVFGWLVAFYILLYFFPEYVVNWTLIADPVSLSLNGGAASQWFLYGFLYCVVMTVMAVRMYIKYRNNMYQIVRTTSVLFFQVAVAFLVPEIMYRLNLPGSDFKNIWPLDYDMFFDWNINNLIAQGNLGIFMIFWGVILFVVGVPIMVYFFGKRWYCSWVCGCGGLAETLGDPYRQLSDKSLRSWKIERYLIHAVLVFAVIMTIGTVYSMFANNPNGYWITQSGFLAIVTCLLVTGGAIIWLLKGEFKKLSKGIKLSISATAVLIFGTSLYGYFAGASQLFYVDSNDLRSSYGFLIGSVFAGVIGTGFYPILGNRVWCRFGCPLAAYLGFVQRFKSKFRITTNGGQCISCGNCSTYCEMGIDVRWYAQRGENIVRSSCVGCGICSAVCPRGVLKLENGPEEGRISDGPIIIGHKLVHLDETAITQN